MLQFLNSTKKPFIGLSITLIERIHVDSFRFFTSDHELHSINVDGDCCSRSIFYELVVPDGALGSPIIDIREYDKEFADTEESALDKIKSGTMAEFAENTDCLSIWDVTFRTEAGIIIFRHMNDSNGYYDGSISIY